MAKERENGADSLKQWPDKIAPYLFLAGAVLSTVGFLMAFLWAAPVNGAGVDGFAMIGGELVTTKLLISQKIFYFHMPPAFVSFVALAFACFYSVQFLRKRESHYDLCARVCMEIALLFVVFTMATGILWTRFEWGVWWTWDPRLTTYLILMLIVIAYFVLRNSVDNAARRKVYAAVVAIISFVDVPICYMVTRLIPSSLHPVVLREGGMTIDMAVTVFLIMAAMMMLGFGLYRLRLRQAKLVQRIEVLKEKQL